MSFSLVGLVPAAGRSVRMGRPKLTLGLGDESVIQRVVRSLRRGGASSVLVVASPIPDADAEILADQARVEGALVVHLAEPTPDMRRTVEHGVRAIEEHGVSPDGILLIPGDFPGLTPGVVAEVVRRFQRKPNRIIVPEHGGKRGHPVALPWELALEIALLPPGFGVNALLKRHGERVESFQVDDTGVVEDMDTPADYQRWVGLAGPGG